jgi:hypothetical protein
VAADGDNRWPLTSSPEARELTANRRWGIDPRSDRLRCCIDPSCTSDICDAASTAPASRAFASCTRSAGRSDGTGLPWSGWRALAACSGVGGHRSPRKPVAPRDHEPTHRAYAPPNSVVSASRSYAPSRPSVGDRAQGKRARNPSAFNQIGTRPPGRWGNARTAQQTPQSKPVTHASRLVAQSAPSVAFGLGMRILAAGPAQLPTVLQWRRLRARSSESLLGLPPRASTDPPPPAIAGSDSHRPCRPQNR